jgi:hypothetical protein
MKGKCMYKKFCIALVITAGLWGVINAGKKRAKCASFAAFKCHSDKCMLNIQGNTVGIAQDDVCYFVPADKRHDKKMHIRCDSGRIIENPFQRESALTGTPGFLSGNHYIGYIVSKPSTPSLMGSGKRIDFYER